MRYTQHLIFIALLVPTVTVLGAAIISLAAADVPAPMTLSQQISVAYDGSGWLDEQP